jgi:hypothetical protein
LNIGIPEIAKYIHDHNLRDLWLSDYSPSLTEFQRLLYLSVLLKEIGPIELLEPTLHKLKLVSTGKPTAISAVVCQELCKSSVSGSLVTVILLSFTLRITA